MARFIIGPLILVLSFLNGSMPVAAQNAKPGGLTSKGLWSLIKAALIATDGEDYFENNLKDAYVPAGAGGVTLFTGTLLSAKPAAHPRVLVVAISDNSTPEVTLQLKDSDWKDSHLSGPIARGSVIQFEGVPISFTKEPFMLTFGVSTTQLSHVVTGRRH